ncbi:MAG: SLBB domain-containing protein [Candidatus Aegiribacteria sp.]|nr:SLBB domain-containing protein [Candidatus Aegiribacteria sp.]
MNLLLFLLVLVGEGIEILPAHPMIEDIDPAEYIIGPGDVFWFGVLGGIPSELTALSEGGLLYITVTPDGCAVIPSAGSWYVANHTLHEAVALIEAGFSARYPGLRAMTGLAVLRTFRVPVTGQIGSAGIVQITGADRLTDLLAKAGGVTPAGAWTNILIIHSDGDTAAVDITKFILDGYLTSNPVLSLGDHVHVPEAEKFVRIEGAVRLSGFLSAEFGHAEVVSWTGSASGILEFIPGETVSDLVTRAGGTEPWAIRDSCHVIRSNPDYEVEIRLPAPLNNSELDPFLMPDDIVVCPGIPPIVAVSGYVFSPGVYPYTAGMDALYYISQAGGFLREGSESGTRIVLSGGEEKRLSEIAAIPAGAIIIIPRKAIIWWQDPLLIATSIASVIIAWKSVF